MERIRLLGQRFGGWWTGVIFHSDGVPKENLALRPMRFCEAISKSQKRPVVLTRRLLDCPGAQRSFGLSTDDEALASLMVEKMGVSLETARESIEDSPCLPKGITAITVGSEDTPDVVVSYAQPEATMKLLRQWQHIHGGDLHVKVSSLMAVCGSVAVGAYLSGRICLSFGCPDSRQQAGISRDRLVVGIPSVLVDELVQELPISAEAPAEPVRVASPSRR